MLDFNDQQLNAAVKVVLTPGEIKSLRPLSKQETEDPLYKFYKILEIRGTKPSNLGTEIVGISAKLDKILTDYVEQWVGKQIGHMYKKTSKGFKNTVGMHMLMYSPTVISHPRLKDNETYYIKRSEYTRLK